MKLYRFSLKVPKVAAQSLTASPKTVSRRTRCPPRGVSCWLQRLSAQTNLATQYKLDSVIGRFFRNHSIYSGTHVDHQVTRAPCARHPRRVKCSGGFQGCRKKGGREAAVGSAGEQNWAPTDPSSAKTGSWCCCAQSSGAPPLPHGAAGHATAAAPSEANRPDWRGPSVFRVPLWGFQACPYQRRRTGDAGRPAVFSQRQRRKRRSFR